MSIQGPLAPNLISSIIPSLTEKNHLARSSQLRTVDTLVSLGAKQEFGAMHAFGMKSIFGAFCSFWNSVVTAIRSFLISLGLLSSMTGGQRENRLREGPENIRARLQTELLYAQAQMDNECDKDFQYTDAATTNLHPHETTVGKYRVGVCHFQGRRPTMEDEHLAEAFTLKIGQKTYPIQLFGIFDGHGGPTAAQFVRDQLRKKLQMTLAEFNPTGLTDVGIWNALKMTFVRLNQDFKSTYGHKTKNYGSYGPGIISDDEGTTATVAMLLDGKLWTANVGDSRTILDNQGIPIQLSEDAKPEDDRYRSGIQHRGGTVIHNGIIRVNGDLAVARSIGDHRLKGAISARPKITVKLLSEIKPGSQLILACDGIYDIASTRQIAHAAYANRNLAPGRLARNLVFSSYESGSTDNLSALVVRFPTN